MEAAFTHFVKKIDGLQRTVPNGMSGFARDFQLLREGSLKYREDKKYSTEAGECAVNRVKNRFKDILPFDSTRVKLPSTGAEGSDYINANFIKGADNDKVYIASQGPLPNTVNDFWRMLWSYKVKIVVMLCREEEGRKKKCQRYWSDDDDEQLNFGGISVRTKKSLAVGNDFMLRTLLAESQGEELMLTQFHYTAWPDHGVPPTAAPLIDLVKMIREYQPNDSPPIVVHCSAGCGRTGTICALDYAQSLLNKTRVEKLDPFKIVRNLRKQRPAMVQTKGQYEFLCRAMCSLFRQKLSLPVDEEMESHLYENVTMPSVNDDSDSDTSLTPSSPFPVNAQAENSEPNKKDDLPSFPAAKEQNSQQRSPVSKKPPVVSEKKRVGQIAQRPNENYVNVTFDLVDVSDNDPQVNTPKPPSNNNVSRTGKTGVNNPVHLQDRVQDRSQKTHTRTDSLERTGRGKNPGKQLFSRSFSCEDDFASKVQRSLSDSKDASEYVIPASKGTNRAPSQSTQSLEKTRNISGKNDGYENVFIPGVQVRPAVSNRPVVAPKTASPANHPDPMYENVDGSKFKAANPVKKSPVGAASRSGLERTGKIDAPSVPTKPKNVKEFVRSQSSSEGNFSISTKQEAKFSSCGSGGGAKYLDQMKALSGKHRAKVLPNENTGNEDKKAENKQEVKFLSANGLRSKDIARKHQNEATCKSGDIVDGSRLPEAVRKPDVLTPTVNEHADSYADSRNKSSSITKKFAFLQGKRHDGKPTPFECIGYGKRLPKPKGPRSPPKSWAVKS